MDFHQTVGQSLQTIAICILGLKQLIEGKFAKIINLIFYSIYMFKVTKVDYMIQLN
jgi:hypothetical protein